MTSKSKIIYTNTKKEKKIDQEPIIIGEHEYVCLKPSGPTDNSPCETEGKWDEFIGEDPRKGSAKEYLPEYEALCKCHKAEHLGAPDEERDPNSLPPFADLASKVPLFREPMDDEMHYAEDDIDECKEIRSSLFDGENYLGCLPPIPNSPLNCDCENPFSEQTDQSGDDKYLRDSRFAEYVRTGRTYSTFWDTPRKTPLLRKSLMNLYSAQIAVGTMPGNLKLKVGDFVEIQGTPSSDDTNLLTGTWMVVKIVFSIPATGFHKNVVTLIRDTRGTYEEKTSIQQDVEAELGL
tara:strand:- start:472 stop:1347 length:876 start_codon:yes stop_codon:yes gene_type:complete